MLVFLIGVTAMLWLDKDTRVALYVAPFWFGLLALGYAGLKRPPGSTGAVSHPQRRSSWYSGSTRIHSRIRRSRP